MGSVCNKFIRYFIRLTYVALKDDGNLILKIMFITLKKDFHIALLSFICLPDSHITQNFKKKEERARDAMRTEILRNNVRCWGENSGTVGRGDWGTEN